MTPEVKDRIEQIRHGIVPEGYKKTKAGVVPADWTEYAIGDCLERVERPVKVQADEMYTQIGIRSHGKGVFYKEPVTGESLGNKAVFWIEPDCFVLNIVFAWEQAIEKTTQNEVGMIGSHRFPMYRPADDRIDIDYLISYLMTKRGKDILEAASPGGAGRNRTLGQERFLKSKLILPLYAEQCQIAEILTTQDKVIGLKEKLLEEKQRQKKYLMQQLLTGKKRLPGFSDDWAEHPLYLHLSESRIVGNNGSNAKKLTVKLWNKGVVEKKEIHLGSESTTYYRRQAGQFIYSKLDFLNCAFGIIPKELDGFESTQDLPCFDIKDIVPQFLLYFVTQECFFKKFGALANGGRKAKRVNPDDFLQFYIAYPSLQEQEAIVQFLSTADRELKTLEQGIEYEKHKKKSLMQLLLTGIVRVNA